MAEVIGVTSGLLTLVVFSLQASKSLYQVVRSFQTNRRSIAQLLEGLEALNEVLESLQDVVANSTADLSALKLPLLRCGKGCKEFEEVIIKCTAHSGGSRASFRDWVKLTYMGNDISGFQDMLEAYKSTIIIALGDATFRTTTVTVDILNEYKEMITKTTTNLEEHLEDIDYKLREISAHGSAKFDENAAEQKEMEEERDSTKKCLEICAEVSAHIDKVQPGAFGSISTTSDAYQPPLATLLGTPSARDTTAKTLDTCKESLFNTTARLQARLLDIEDRLQQHLSSKAPRQHEQIAERERLQEERDSKKQMLAICAQAFEHAEKTRTSYYEDIRLTDDAHKVAVSTVGDLISAKRITAGARSTLWMGQMSDASLQQLSRDRVRTTPTREPPTSESPTGEPTTGELSTKEAVQSHGQFEGRYGTGRRLSRESSTGAGAERKLSRGSSSSAGTGQQPTQETFTSAGAKKSP
ncbi:hypothetical protein BU26DRAFT_446892 [Trematosphaeria pertusa]|uniref:Azaphilone pigments biosynthesis cluster protein L N-terminal domain-containing protein n=1 Tax=Trematosphaeria pertusa TaxID=390896 RepID=A0A6A6J3N5_9PLEO|nr:uncharacterized protein BU26DRAFT_446892 [Trematosphaeria pertusa]KAF2257434.1 hypothetical protein BU26DRAFT_446892 [Trematosphaeria pertusa]